MNQVKIDGEKTKENLNLLTYNKIAKKTIDDLCYNSFMVSCFDNMTIIDITAPPVIKNSYLHLHNDYNLIVHNNTEECKFEIYQDNFFNKITLPYPNINNDTFERFEWENKNNTIFLYAYTSSSQLYIYKLHQKEVFELELYYGPIDWDAENYPIDWDAENYSNLTIDEKNQLIFFLQLKKVQNNDYDYNTHLIINQINLITNEKIIIGTINENVNRELVSSYTMLQNNNKLYIFYGLVNQSGAFVHSAYMSIWKYDENEKKYQYVIQNSINTLYVTQNHYFYFKDNDLYCLRTINSEDKNKRAHSLEKCNTDICNFENVWISEFCTYDFLPMPAGSRCKGLTPSPIWYSYDILDDNGGNGNDIKRLGVFQNFDLNTMQPSEIINIPLTVPNNYGFEPNKKFLFGNVLYSSYEWGQETIFSMIIFNNNKNNFYFNNLPIDLNKTY